MMTRSLFMQAFKRLGEMAWDEGMQVECCQYGGALMMLAYDARISTKDVDAVIRPRDPALRFAHRVGEELGLPENWLNDQVRIFLAPSEQLRELPYYPDDVIPSQHREILRLLIQEVRA